MWLYIRRRLVYKTLVAANIEPFYKELGQRIRNVRTTQGMTQEKLGRSLKPSLTRVSIANVESGNQRILAHTLVQLAQVLEVELVELLPIRKDDGVPTSRDVADELVAKAGLSKTTAKKLLERPQTIKPWKETKS